MRWRRGSRSGKTIGGVAAETAVIVRMRRVMMLAPFLIVLGRVATRSATTASSPAKSFPVFAVVFIIIALVHPYLGLPSWLVAALRTRDVVLLAAAMAALGLDTTIAKLRLAGRDSLLLGAILFGYLVVMGGAAELAIQHAFAAT